MYRVEGVKASGDVLPIGLYPMLQVQPIYLHVACPSAPGLDLLSSFPIPPHCTHIARSGAFCTGTSSGIGIGTLRLRLRLLHSHLLELFPPYPF